MSNDTVAIQKHVRNLINRGNSYARAGRLEDSIPILSEARDLAKQNDLYDEELQSSLTLSYCAQLSGDKRVAILHLNRCIELSNLLNDLTFKGKCLLNLGVLTINEDSVAAIKYFENAFTLFESTEDHQGMGQCLDNVGIAYNMLCSLRAAANYMGRAEKHFELAGDPIELAINYRAQANLLTDMANQGLEESKETRQWARNKYNMALQLFDKYGARIDAAKCTDSLALLYRDEGNFEKAIFLHREAIENLSTLGTYPLLSSALVNLGTTFEKACQYEDALVAFNQAKEIKKSTKDYAGIARISNNEAVIMNTLGRFEEAIPLSIYAIEKFEQLKDLITDEYIRSKFSERYNATWSEYLYSLLCLNISETKSPPPLSIALALETSKANLLNNHLSELPVASDSINDANLKRIQREIEQRQIICIASEQRASLRRKLKYEIIDRDKFDTEIQKVINIGQKAFFELQELRQTKVIQDKQRFMPLDPTVVLSKILNSQTEMNNLLFIYIMEFPTREKIVFGIITRQSVQYRPVDLVRKDREALFSKLRALHEVKPVSQEDVNEKESELQELSKQLGNILSQAGILEVLEQQQPSSIVLLPQGMLHLIPWEIATTSESYLGTQYAILRNYSATFLYFMHERLTDTPIFQGEYNAIVYCPMPQELRGTKKEVDRVEYLLNQAGVNVCVVNDGCATSKTFVKDCQIDSLEIIHFAGHSTLSQADPMLSSLVLNDAHTTALEIESRIRFNRTPFVCLSSCDSAVAEINNFDDAFGLVRAFLFSGARSLLLSNWFVLDSSAGDFTEAFYESALLEEHSIEDALRTARQIVSERARANKYAEEGDLIHWAPYCLYGTPCDTLVSTKPAAAP